MNLVLVNYEYPPLGGGAGNATAHLARGLRTLGHDVVVVTAAYRDVTGWGDDGGARVLRIKCLRRSVHCASLVEMLSYVMHACWTVPRLAARLKADGCVVFFSLPCGPIGWLTKRVTGVPYVVALRGGDVPGAESSVSGLQKILAPVRRAVLAGARAVTANSGGLAAISSATDAFPVDVIPNGVDTEFFRPGPGDGKHDETVRLLFVGRFNGQKNLAVLLQQFAIAHARVPTIRLTMVGDGPHRSMLEAEANRLGIVDAVSWLGWMAKPELAQLYRDVDIFLNPSLYEGMPNTVMEAMASGLPVIASAVAGNDELVEHDRTGLLFNLDDRDALAEAMVFLSANPHLRASYGRSGRAAVVSKYSWEATAQHYAAYFQPRVAQ